MSVGLIGERETAIMIGEAQPGDVVVNTKTKIAYNIASVTTGGLYQLEYRYGYSDPFRTAPPPAVRPDDPDYVLARRSTSSTESNLVARREEILEIVPGLSKDLSQKRLIQELIKYEKVCPEGQHVFYNAAGPRARLLHRMGKILIRRLHAVLDGEPPAIDNFEFLRLPALDYDPRTFLTPTAFLECVFAKGTWSDHDPRRPVLSTNLSVFGDIRAGGSENSLSIFFEGGLFDVDPKQTLNIFEGLVASYRLQRDLGEMILAIVGRTLKSIATGKTKCPSAIYQIFLFDEVLDHVAYISTQCGFPLDNPVARLYGFKEKLDKKYGLVMEPRCPQFTRTVLKLARTTEYWSTFEGGNDPQARLIMNPNFFATPSSDVKILVYEPDSSQFTEYNQLLREFDETLEKVMDEFIVRYQQTLVAFQKEHAKALAALKIDMVPTEVDLSISILTDMVNSLPAILTKIEQSGFSLFDFL